MKRTRGTVGGFVVASLLCLCATAVWGQLPEQREKELGDQPWSLADTPEVMQLALQRRPDVVPREPEPEISPEEVERNVFTPVPDRWRIGYQRNLLNPYNQNVLKGDYPIIGDHVFFIFTGISDTLVEFRELPTPVGPSSERADSADFFGKNDQLFVRQNFVLRFQLLEGNTAFKPLDWILEVVPVFNINYLDVQEVGIVNTNVQEGTTRLRDDIALQEAFFEYHLRNISPRYDFFSVKVGIQPFNSDFRSFMFTDTNLGARFFGNFANNRFQYNLAFFDQLEKDTNSELNTFERREQQIVIANLYWQDFIWFGYTNQFSIHYNHDEASLKFDDNNFLVRPDPVGDFTPHEIDAVYLGWTSDGHIGRFNVSHALYVAFGHDDHNPLAGRSQDIFGQLFALEVSMDFDWLRPKASFLYVSGDANPADGDARGFDSIFDRPQFAGGQNSFFNRQGIRLLGVGLNQRESLIPNLRGSKIQGQVNFVNPGLMLFHAGLDVEVTPKLRMFLNTSYLRFVHTEPLELLLKQGDLSKEIGIDTSIAFFYRPILHNNIIITAGVAALFPSRGFRDILSSQVLLQGFFNMILTY